MPAWFVSIPIVPVPRLDRARRLFARQHAAGAAAGAVALTLTLGWIATKRRMPSTSYNFRAAAIPASAGV